MKYLRSLIIILVVIGLLIGAKFLFFPAKKDKKAAVAGSKPTASATAVTVVVTSSSTEGDKMYASGSILANEEADLYTETSGRIEYINIPEGKQVQKGVLLLKLNDNEFKAQLNKVSSQLKLARGSLARQKQLLDIEGSSQQEFEQAVANLGAFTADSAFYRAQIAKTEVRAPFNGVLGIKQVSIGSYISPTTVISTISQIDPVKIDFYLPEKYTTFLKAGDKIMCSIEGTTKSFSATITVKDPRIDLKNRSVRFRAICPNPKGQLMPGSFVRIELKMNNSQKTLFIPTESSIATLKGKKVFIVKNNKAEEREIVTGLRTAKNIQVLSGLQPGDSVVVTGNYQLKEGGVVKVISKGKL